MRYWRWPLDEILQRASTSPSEVVDDLTESYCVPEDHPIFLIANGTRIFTCSFTSCTACDLQNQNNSSD